MSDNGQYYAAGGPAEYLRMRQLRHTRFSPHHPQTNGKLDRFHELPIARTNHQVWTSPEELGRPIAELTEFHNHRRYH